MNLKKVLYNGIKFGSIQGFVATKIYEEVTDAVGERKKDNEVKRRREDAITERIRNSKVVEYEESSSVGGEFGGGIQGENIYAKVSAKGENSRKMRFED